jgi:hypothetical protein
MRVLGRPAVLDIIHKPLRQADQFSNAIYFFSGSRTSKVGLL